MTYYWDVETTRRWMNRLARPLRWLFAWNHNWVMAQGERGLADWLRRGSSAGGAAPR